MLEILHSTSRGELKDRHVVYRVRWDRENERYGTVGRIGNSTLWIGCACFSHGDVVAMREAV